MEPGAARPSVDDERFPSERRQRKGFARAFVSSKSMPVRQSHHHRLLQQGLYEQAIPLGDGRTDKGGIGSFIAQNTDQFRRSAFFQGQCDQWESLAVDANDARYKGMERS